MQIQSHRSPGLTAIYNELNGSSNKRIMDLGPMRVGTFNFFSQIKCNIHFENLDSFLEEYGNLSVSNLLLRLEKFLLSQHGKEKFNAILAWDFFNFLPPESLKVVLELLAPFCANDSILHLFSYTTRGIPAKPCCFNIKDQYYINIEKSKFIERKAPPLATSKLLKNTPDYLLQESMVNKEGMQPGIAEYLLRYSPGKKSISKRALPKIEMQDFSVSDKKLPEHVSPSLAWIKNHKVTACLDLGPDNRHNASWFSKRYPEVYSENVLAILQRRLLQKISRDGTEFGMGLFNFDLSLRFDLVYFWDILSFLDARQMNELLVRLRPFVHTNTLFIAYLHSSARAPNSPRIYKFYSDTKLKVADYPLKYLTFKPHSAIEFTKCLPGINVKKTFLFQPGMMPGLSEYILGFNEVKA